MPAWNFNLLMEIMRKIDTEIVDILNLKQLENIKNSEVQKVKGLIYKPQVSHSCVTRLFPNPVQMEMVS